MIIFILLLAQVIGFGLFGQVFRLYLDSGGSFGFGLSVSEIRGLSVSVLRIIDVR